MAQAKTRASTKSKPKSKPGKSRSSKLKVPLVAGGAALAGAAGGLALGMRRGHRGKSRNLAKAAKGVGNFGAQVGSLASELQRAREANGTATHRSPVEVVLEGLTARRSRH